MLTVREEEVFVSLDQGSGAQVGGVGRFWFILRVLLGGNLCSTKCFRGDSFSCGTSQVYIRGWELFVFDTKAQGTWAAGKLCLAPLISFHVAECLGFVYYVV